MLKNSPLVSVIIPTYNRAGPVTKAIDSVLAQTYKNYEVIVIDDGSTDNTMAVLKAYRDRIRYIYQNNAGVSGALNAGINLARGEWIAILGSDDEWLPEKLSVQISQISDRQDIVLHTTNVSLITEMNEDKHLFRVGQNVDQFCATGYISKPNDDVYIVDKPLFLQVNHGLARTQAAIIRRNALEKVGFFNTKLTMFEDHDLMCRLALEAPWMVTNRVLVKIIRRSETERNLSEQLIFDPVSCAAAYVYIYEKILICEKLSATDKRNMTFLLSTKRTALAMEQLKVGQKTEARKNLRFALSEKFCARTLLKYFVSLLPGKITPLVIDKWRKAKKRLKCLKG